MFGIDTVGELGRDPNCAWRMASLKAQDHGNAYAERLAWEGGNRFANSIGIRVKTGHKNTAEDLCARKTIPCMVA
jgi:hypothetical protein